MRALAYRHGLILLSFLLIINGEGTVLCLLFSDEQVLQTGTVTAAGAEAGGVLH